MGVAMIRTCDGTDCNLITEDGGPCRCGLTFDDVDHRVIYPHERIPTREEKAAAMAALAAECDDPWLKHLLTSGMVE
jgi:hypothetical protein